MLSGYTAAAETISDSAASFDYTNLGYGLYGINIEDINNMSVNTSTRLMDAQVSLPTNMDLSTQNYFPTIREQKANSCVAWATTYYQFTYQASRLNGWDAKHDDSKVFSPKYIYNYNNCGDKDNSCYFADCYGFLKWQGSLRWNEFPETDKALDWYQGPNDAETVTALQNALKTRVSEWSYNKFAAMQYVPNTTAPVITSNTDSQLNEIKGLLNDGYCLAVGTSIDPYDIGIDTGFFYSTLSNGAHSGEQVCLFTRGSEYNHAITIVGYDDNIWYDLNGDGVAQDYEKGAFKLANSWGTDYRNDGYIWVMYDALNLVSNVSDSNLNPSDRLPFMQLNNYYWIEVENYIPQLTVEVTVQQKNRGDFTILLGRSDTVDSTQTTAMTIIRPLYSGQIGFNGLPVSSDQTRIFVFDYSACHNRSGTPITDVDCDLYDGINKAYWVDVQDNTGGNGANTTIQKIRWKNSSGTLIKELGQQTSLNGSTGLYNSNVLVSSISLNKTSSTLGTNESDVLTAIINPNYATNQKVNWFSSNSSVATVDNNGNIMGVSKGTVTITARTTDGSNLSASCTYSIVKHVASITLNKTNSTLLKGQTEQLTASITPTDADNKAIIWFSSNTSVVTVSSSGLVTYIGSGTAIVTATAQDTGQVNASCTYTIADDYSNTSDKAYIVTLNSQNNGKTEVSGDVDFFKFTPSVSGTYIFYTDGTTDTMGYLYDYALTQLAYNDDASISGNNFAVKYNLTAGAVYYIKVGAYSNRTGSYTFVITKGVYSASLADNNQDARRVQMQAEAAAILTCLQVHIGNNTYTLNKPASGTLDTTINGAHFKVTFSTSNNGLSTIWNIETEIPATASGITDTVYFSFSKGTITQINSNNLNGFVAYASSIKTSVNPNSTLQTLLNSMAQTGYSLTVRNWDNTLVNVLSTTKSATGMKIIKKNTTNNMIEEIYYVVVFGDVIGNGIVGNGIIDSQDSLAVLQHSVQTSVLGVISQLAADVDHDDDIDASDAQIILQHSVGKTVINQNFTISVVPDDCYYLDPVIF